VFLSVISPPEVPVITFQDTILISTPASAYQWYVNGNMIEGATSQLHVPQVNGNYNVRVFNDFDCTSISIPANVNWVGFSDPVLNPVKFFPNPSSGEAWIESPCELKRIGIYTAQGKLVREMNFENLLKQHIRLIDEPAGVYFIQVESCNQQYILKWIKW
jgi:hypothetical protein